MCRSVLVQFCNMFGFLPKFGIRSVTWFWQKDPEYIPSQVSESILNFPFSCPSLLLTLYAALEYRQTSSGVPFFSKELPTRDIDDIKHTGHAFGTEGSLLPPHTTDPTLKSSSLKAFLENGHIPEFSNSSKIFFKMSETECAEAIIPLDQGCHFSRIGHHPLILFKCIRGVVNKFLE